MMKDFRDLKVWHKAHRLTLATYRMTKKLPSDEKWGLVRQLRRAAGSIAANLAEGCGRSGDREFGRFVSIAMGSASELEYHLLLARDLGLIFGSTHEALAAKTIEVKRMLAAQLSTLTAES